jgi:serine/threonine-protein kinase
MFREQTVSRLSRLRRVSYTRLVREQEPPFANLAYGAAGLAYALLRAALTLEDDRALRQAARLLDDALAASRRRSAFLPARVPPEHCPRTSIFFGLPGMHFVRALVAHAAGDRRGASRSVAAFIAGARRGLDGPLELYGGLAGVLSAATVLSEVEPALPELAALGRTVRDRLLAAAGPGEPWDGLPANMIAHGRAGVAAALLQWAAREGSAVPGRLLDALQGLRRRTLAILARSSIPEPRGAYVRGSFCSGAAGYALVFVMAHRHTGDERFRTAAVRFGTVARSSSVLGPSACCESAGACYALAALARADPAGRWRRRAEQLAARSLAAPHWRRWRYNLMRGGEGGLLCLAADFAQDAPPRFPPFGFF